MTKQVNTQEASLPNHLEILTMENQQVSAHTCTRSANRHPEKKIGTQNKKKKRKTCDINGIH